MSGSLDVGLRPDAGTLPASDADSNLSRAFHAPVEAGDVQGSSSGARMPALPLPFQVGPYLLRRFVGSGGSADVYEGEDTTLGLAVAVKVLDPARLGRDGAQQVLHEGRILARLKHPNVAHVYGTGTLARRAGGEAEAAPEPGEDDAGEAEVPTDDWKRRVECPYLVVELVKDARPITVDAAQRSLDERARVELLLQACEGVAYVHNAGVIHRDLKPGNLPVDGDGVVKIVDFGIARLLDPDLDDLPRTIDTGLLAGTLEYMPPERIEWLLGRPREGAYPPVSFQGDVYALGVIAYELLAGHRPFAAAERGGPFELARAICEDEPPPLGRRNPQWGAELEAVVAKAMARNPAARYASVSEFAKNLRRYLNGEPVEAENGAGWVYDARVFFHRHRSLVGSAAAVAAALGVGLGVAAWQAVRATRAHARSAAQLEGTLATVETLLEGPTAALSLVPGTTDARGQLIDGLLAHLHDSEEMFQAHPRLREALADAYFRYGQLAGDPTAVNRGETGEAATAFDESLRLLNELLVEDPNRPALHRKIAQTRHRLALLSLPVETLPVALEHHRQAVEHWHVVCLSAEGNWNDRSELARCMQWCCDHLNKLGQTTEASNLAMQHLGRLEALPSLPLVIDEDRHEAGALWLAQSLLNTWAGDLGAAIRCCEQRRAVLEPLLNRPEVERDWLLTYADTFRYGGRAHRKAGRTAQAAADVGRSLIEYEDIRRRWPGRHEVEVICVSTAVEWGGILEAAGDIPSAADAHERAMTAACDYAAAFPEYSSRRLAIFAAQQASIGCYRMAMAIGDNARAPDFETKMDLLRRAGRACQIGLDQVRELESAGEMPAAESNLERSFEAALAMCREELAKMTEAQQGRAATTGLRVADGGE